VPDTHSPDTVKTSPAANPSVTLRFDFGTSQEIAPLHAVRLATCDLAEHVPTRKQVLGNKFFPGSPYARNTAASPHKPQFYKVPTGLLEAFGFHVSTEP
jgi:hypothetical protein